MSRLASFALSLSVFASALSAQVPIVLRGEVTDGSAAGCYYCPGYSHVIKHSGTVLASPTINLNLYHNQYCKLTGTWNGAVVEVSAIEVVAESFSIGGSGVLGGTFDFTAHAVEGDLAINALAITTSCIVPFGDCGFLLAPASLGILGMGACDNDGEYGCTIDIPNIPGLVGLRVFGQALVMQQDGALWTTNVDAKEIG